MKKRKNLRYLRSLGLRKQFSFSLFLSKRLNKYYQLFSNLPAYKNIFNYFRVMEFGVYSRYSVYRKVQGSFWLFAQREFASWNFSFNPKRSAKELFTRLWLSRYGQRNLVLSSFKYPRSLR